MDLAGTDTQKRVQRAIEKRTKLLDDRRDELNRREKCLDMWEKKIKEREQWVDKTKEIQNNVQIRLNQQQKEISERMEMVEQLYNSLKTTTKIDQRLANQKIVTKPFTHGVTMNGPEEVMIVDTMQMAKKQKMSNVKK